MDKINFEDLPSTNTPINADNLNNLQDNVDNAKLDKIITATEAGGNLDDYLDEGTYYFYGISDAPSGTAGWLRVLTTTKEVSIKQIWWRSAQLNGKNEFFIYIRAKIGTTWSSWEKIATEHDCYYMAGDSFGFYLKPAIRANANDIRFQIPLDKPVKSGVTPTVTISTATLFQSTLINMTDYIDTINSASVAGSVIEVNAQLTSTKPSSYSANVATTGDIRVTVTFS